jgi:hypothetical protein
LFEKIPLFKNNEKREIILKKEKNRAKKKSDVDLI